MVVMEKGLLAIENAVCTCGFFLYVWIFNRTSMLRTALVMKEPLSRELSLRLMDDPWLQVRGVGHFLYWISDLYLLEIHSQKRQKYLLMCAKIRLLADLLIYIAFCALFWWLLRKLRGSLSMVLHLVFEMTHSYGFYFYLCLFSWWFIWDLLSHRVYSLVPLS